MLNYLGIEKNYISVKLSNSFAFISLTKRGDCTHPSSEANIVDESEDVGRA